MGEKKMLSDVLLKWIINRVCVCSLLVKFWCNLQFFIIISSGCWIHFTKDAPNECQISRCEEPASNWTDDMQFHFCCCTGNKCNDVQQNARDSKGQDYAPALPKVASVKESKVKTEGLEFWLEQIKIYENIWIIVCQYLENFLLKIFNLSLPLFTVIVKSCHIFLRYA